MRIFSLMLVAGLLSGCIARQLEPATLIYDSLFSNPASYQNTPLQEGVEFLEFQAPEGTGLLFKSYQDKAYSSNAPIKTFTVNPGAVIRLQHGLIIHFDTTVNQQWVNLRFDQLLGTWSENRAFKIIYDLPTEGLYNLQREAQVLPLEGASTLEQLNRPLANRLLASQLNFEIKRFEFSSPLHIEHSFLNSWLKPDHLQPISAIVAYNQGQAVYGYQCFTPSYCFDYLIRSNEQPL